MCVDVVVSLLIKNYLHTRRKGQAHPGVILQQETLLSSQLVKRFVDLYNLLQNSLLG